MSDQIIIQRDADGGYTLPEIVLVGLATYPNYWVTPATSVPPCDPSPSDPPRDAPA